jgi:hypothetical protein
LLIFLLLLFGPIAASAARYFWIGDGRGNWQTADRSSAGLLPPAGGHPEAVIRVFAARTVRWRGIFAVHTWIVVKEKDAPSYSRYDYTAWGEPIRTNGFAPDGRWFGAPPETIVAVNGERAEPLIPKIRRVVENYKLRSYGDYSPWPGPNSNTFCGPPWTPFPNCARSCRRPRSERTNHTMAGGSEGRRPAQASFLSLAGYLGRFGRAAGL